MNTIHSELAEKLCEIISTAIQRVREIFVAERLAAGANNSISKAYLEGRRTSALVCIPDSMRTSREVRKVPILLKNSAVEAQGVG
jgi:hypothetical protein